MKYIVCLVYAVVVVISIILMAAHFNCVPSLSYPFIEIPMCIPFTFCVGNEHIILLFSVL